MKCFTHQEVDAIGSCRNCGKGLCSACAKDLQFALSCHGSCESELIAIRAQVLRSRALLDTQKRFRLMAPIFFALMGVVFIVTDLSSGHVSWLPMSFGSLCLVFAAAMYAASRRWTRK
jgi:hypothetical protein